MATTFQMANGDVVISNVTGQPRLIGNAVGENDIAKAKQKTAADLQRCLSIGRIQDGTGAGISELKGIVPGIGGATLSVLLSRQVRNMFAAIIQKQRRSLVYRPLAELFYSIILLRVYADVADKTAYRFRLDTKTKSGVTVTQAGVVRS